MINKLKHYPSEGYNPLHDIWFAMPDEPFELSEGFLEYCADRLHQYGVECEKLADVFHIIELLAELKMFNLEETKDSYIVSKIST